MNLQINNLLLKMNEKVDLDNVIEVMNVTNSKDKVFQYIPIIINHLQM